MAGTTVTVEDPEFVETKEVDSNGRIYVGKGHSGRKYRIVAELIEEGNE